jgi:hypothetical protein
MADSVILPSGAVIELPEGPDYIVLPTGEIVLEAQGEGEALGDKKLFYVKSS